MAGYQRMINFDDTPCNFHHGGEPVGLHQIIVIQKNDEVSSREVCTMISSGTRKSIFLADQSEIFKSLDIVPNGSSHNEQKRSDSEKLNKFLYQWSVVKAGTDELDQTIIIDN